MHRLLFLIVVSAGLVLTGCSGLPFGSKYQTTTTNMVLGSIGKTDNHIGGIPTKTNGAIPLIKPITITITKSLFTTKTTKAFHNAKTYQHSTSVSQKDSLVKTNYFLTLTLADEPELLHQLNADKSMQQYLKTNTKTGIVGAIQIAFPKNMQTQLQEADLVQLTTNKYNYFSLQLITNTNITTTIDFNEGIIFGYQYIYPCWQEDDHHQISIAGFSYTGSPCANGSYKKAKKAKQKINYYKL